MRHFINLENSLQVAKYRTNPKLQNCLGRLYFRGASLSQPIVWSLFNNNIYYLINTLNVKTQSDTSRPTKHIKRHYILLIYLIRQCHFYYIIHEVLQWSVLHATSTLHTFLTDLFKLIALIVTLAFVVELVSYVMFYRISYPPNLIISQPCSYYVFIYF